VAAKKHLFLRQTASDYAVIAVDDDYTRAIADANPRAVRVSAARLAGSECYMEQGELVDASTVPEQHFELGLIATLRGAHNHQNALVAFAACRRLGYAAETIFDAMKSFEGLSHRMERVATIDHVLFINDSKATNADAAEKSLTSFENLYWILGGVPKAGGIASLVPHFGRVKHAYCIGEAAEAFAATLKEHDVPYRMCGTLDVAVRQAFTDARGQQDAVVLFAPACASFDQFTNFEARGDAFKALVAALS
jgi:UDP-N-acetylmuramoylalanine--D-glutamate ligase